MGDWEEQLAAVRVRLETATQQGVAMTTESKTRPRPGMFELQANIKRINEQLAEFAKRMEALEAATAPDFAPHANGNGHYPKLV